MLSFPAASQIHLPNLNGRIARQNSTVSWERSSAALLLCFLSCPFAPTMPHKGAHSLRSSHRRRFFRTTNRRAAGQRFSKCRKLHEPPFIQPKRTDCFRRFFSLSYEFSTDFLYIGSVKTMKMPQISRARSDGIPGGVFAVYYLERVGQPSSP